jgi:hypothetical protein
LYGVKKISVLPILGAELGKVAYSGNPWLFSAAALMELISMFELI